MASILNIQSELHVFYVSTIKTVQSDTRSLMPKRRWVRILLSTSAFDVGMLVAFVCHLRRRWDTAKAAS